MTNTGNDQEGGRHSRPSGHRLSNGSSFSRTRNSPSNSSVEVELAFRVPKAAPLDHWAAPRPRFLFNHPRTVFFWLYDRNAFTSCIGGYPTMFSEGSLQD